MHLRDDGVVSSSPRWSPLPAKVQWFVVEDNRRPRKKSAVKAETSIIIGLALHKQRQTRDAPAGETSPSQMRRPLFLSRRSRGVVRVCERSLSHVESLTASLEEPASRLVRLECTQLSGQPSRRFCRPGDLRNPRSQSGIRPRHKKVGESLCAFLPTGDRAAAKGLLLNRFFFLASRASALGEAARQAACGGTTKRSARRFGPSFSVLEPIPSQLFP